MKFLIVSLAVVAMASAQYPAQYAPQDAILSQEQEIFPDGSYVSSYQAENGIAASESGAPKAVGPNGEQAVVVQGQFQYTAPDGSPIALTYVADENGFQPQGAHLPTPPPVPELILRSLAYNAAHPEQSEGQSQYNHQPQFNQPQYNQPQYNRRF